MKALWLSCVSAVAAALVLLSRGELQGQNKDRAQFKVPDNVELIRDVEYGNGGDRPLKLHILRAKEAPKEATPVLVWIHGGGWQAGDRGSGISRLAAYAARGYFCATIEYRLSAEAIFPAQIEDCKCAIRFLRAKAKESLGILDGAVFVFTHGGTNAQIAMLLEVQSGDAEKKYWTAGFGRLNVGENQVLLDNRPFWTEREMERSIPADHPSNYIRRVIPWSVEAVDK